MQQKICLKKSYINFNDLNESKIYDALKKDLNKYNDSNFL